MSYRRSESSTVEIQAPAHQVLTLLDDPKPSDAYVRSIMMLGSSMTYELDETEGRQIGSVIK